MLQNLEASTSITGLELMNKSFITSRFIFYYLILLSIFRTDVWEMLKWAWIQFLAIYIVVRTLFNSLSAFLYQNHILETFIVCPQNWEDRDSKFK